MAPRPESSTTQDAISPEDRSERAGAALLIGGEPADGSIAPRAALEALHREKPPGEELLANLMDEAMAAMLARHPVARASAPPSGEPDQDGVQEFAAEDFGASLTSAEADALAQEAFVQAPPNISEPLEFDGLASPAMPTDEELAALFAESADEPQSYADAPVASAASGRDRVPASKAALDLESELLRDEGPAEEHDEDAIQADLALEARASVNILEPPAAQADSQNVAPALDRPLEPEGARRSGAWWMAPLVWLNAPFSTPAVRDGAGKLALLVLLNATAVLVYVYVIRR